ncbi:MAG: hypothetical protein AABX48_03980 [Nanoarchaeota archaeon]
MAKEKEIKWKPFWVILRLVTGFVFLWAFLDKVFGLGFSTAHSKAWIFGGSPTKGFLSSTSGIFSGFFHTLASSNFVAWLFMLGLLFIGLTFILGIGMRLGAIAGTAMVFLMWLSLFPSSNNPLIDDHWFYAFAMIASVLNKSGNYFGFGKWWSKINFVKEYPIFE